MTATRTLLVLAAENKAKGTLRLLLLIAIGLALPVTAVIDFVRQRAAEQKMRQVLAVTSVTCPRGHVVELAGGFACPACGLAREGHPFAPCPHCGELTAAVRCPCGLQVKNALWSPEDAS